MNIRPLYDRVIIEQAKVENVSSGGIVLTGNKDSTSSRGKVVAVGSGRLLADGTVQTLEVKVGDNVIFGNYIERSEKIDGVEYVITKEDNILGIVVE